MSLPSACLHSQGPHLAVSGGRKTGKTAVLWEPRLLLWILKRDREGERGSERERERERTSYLDKTKLGLESPEHIISTALSLHTQGTLEKWGGRWMGKEVIKKANFFEKSPVCVCVCVCVSICMHASVCLQLSARLMGTHTHIYIWPLPVAEFQLSFFGHSDHWDAKKY